MLPKPLVWLAALALLACAEAAYSAPLPVAPSDAPLARDEPIYCPDRMLYLHVYDTNPATQAAVAVIGPSDPGHSHGDPFVVAVSSDEGLVTWYVYVKDHDAEMLTSAEMLTRFGHNVTEAVCNIAASRRI